MANPYSLEADVRIQSPFKDDTNITDAYITQKIAEADDMIDSIVSEVYVMPLPSNPDIIVSLSKGIATCLLLREQNSNIEVEPGVTVEDAWDNKMEMLEGIRTRQLKLLDSAGVELPVTSRFVPSFYPTNASSEVDAVDSTAPKVKMNKKF